MSGQNLDRLCAEHGYQMAVKTWKAYGGDKKAAQKAENHLTKSLGVLQEDGVYAFFLYQVSRGKDERKDVEALKQQAAELLKKAELAPFDRLSDPLEAVRGNKETTGLADDLNALLLAKRLLEQALIYARYHAKALGE